MAQPPTSPGTAASLMLALTKIDTLRADFYVKYRIFIFYSIITIYIYLLCLFVCICCVNQPIKFIFLIVS